MFAGASIACAAQVYNQRMAAIPPTLLLLSGAPGAGKTTLQCLSPDVVRPLGGYCAAFGTDDVYQLVDPNWALVQEERCHTIARQNCLLLARSFFEQELRLVMIAGNALYHPDHYAQYQAALGAHCRVCHITLDARDEVVVERVRARGDLAQHPPAWLAEWLAHVRSFLGPWTTRINTSDQSPAETLQHIAVILFEQGVQHDSDR